MPLFGAKRPAAMDQNPETQAVESLLLNECEIKFFLFFHSHMHRSSKAWARTTSSVRPSMTTSTFTGTDRGLLRSVLGPWSPVPKCDAPRAPISVEEHTSMAPRPRRQSQNPPLQKSSAVPALPWPSKPRLRYSPGLAPTTRLNALLNAASDS